MSDRVFVNPFIKRKFVAIALCVTLTGGLASCDEKFDRLLGRPQKISLDKHRGTQWKLAYVDPNGVYDLEHPLITERTILEPHDCDTCYTLTFDDKKTGYITVVSILNTIIIQTNPSGILQTIDFVTDFDEPYDGNLFYNLMKSVRTIDAGAGAVSVSVRDATQTSHFLVFEQINP